MLRRGGGGIWLRWWHGAVPMCSARRSSHRVRGCAHRALLRRVLASLELRLPNLREEGVRCRHLAATGDDAIAAASATVAAAVTPVARSIGCRGGAPRGRWGGGGGWGGGAAISCGAIVAASAHVAGGVVRGRPGGVLEDGRPGTLAHAEGGGGHATEVGRREGVVQQWSCRVITSATQDCDIAGGLVVTEWPEAPPWRRSTDGDLHAAWFAARRVVESTKVMLRI